MFEHRMTKRGSNKKEFSRDDIARGVEKYEKEIHLLKIDLSYAYETIKSFNKVQAEDYIESLVILENRLEKYKECQDEKRV